MAEIKRPRHIMLLAVPGASTSSIEDALASSAEPPSAESPWREHHIKTPYYSAKVPIWTDAIESPAEWAQQWKSTDGAASVVEDVAAWIVAFEKPASRAGEAEVQTYLASVAEVVAHHVGSYADAAMLAVALPTSQAGSYAFDLARWEDLCGECGSWEAVDAEAGGDKNSFGERTGIPRIVEALQTAEWERTEQDLDELLGFDDDDNADAPSDTEDDRSSMREPILGASTDPFGTAAADGADAGDVDVERLQHMMAHLQATRDLGADLPAAERRKLAAKAVKEVMRGG